MERKTEENEKKGKQGKGKDGEGEGWRERRNEERVGHLK